MDVEITPSEYKILIVDDIMTNVLLLKVLLSGAKYQIATAMNGREALEMAGKVSPDLILLDVMMPDINGFEVAEKLKSMPDLRNIPIIFLTAINDTTNIVKGFKIGANDYITKPFNKEELLIRVKHQLSLVAANRIILNKTEELANTIVGRDKLYSVIAHDLRSPMGSIKMVLNMLVQNIGEDQIGKEMYEMLSMANQTTEETFSLLDNLLKWTKSQIGRLKTVFQEVNLIELIEDATEVFKPVSQLKNIPIEIRMPERIDVRIDVDMVKTILRNLMSNAVKFSQEGSPIIVEVEENETHAIVNVQDFGMGIKEEDQPKVLNPDTHYTTYGTRNEEGSGLGLLLCLDFAHKNGGELWFISKEGEGSTFSFSVPKLTEAGPDTEKPLA
ncbi:MAG: hybrid sensor histidine kinase/response regulator [Rikenellaceae bacterium]|nr:hybrid sensor histidine kinase/response regulator [Rikenellaceae bacterium]